MCNAQNKSTYIPEDLNKRAEEVADQIYKGTFKGKLDPEMVNITASFLNKAVTSNYGKTKIDYNTPDWNMLANLEKNVYQFSAAKNYQQLKTMTLALKDDKGNIRSFDDFKRVTGQINSQYNQWLETEYSAAIGASQMASKWTGFSSEAMLEYRTAGDLHVRDDHAKLNGVVKEKKDPFWNSYYPPNGWGCRCTVIEVDSETTATSDKSFETPKVPEMWRVNTAKQGLVFPPGHPYYKGLPAEVKKQALDLYQKSLHDIEKEYESGGKLIVSHIVNRNESDFKDLLLIGNHFAEKGSIVEILPRLHYKDKLYKEFFTGAHPRKCPDLKIDDKFFEFESYTGEWKKNKVFHMLKKGLTQSDNVIIDLRNGVAKDDFIKRSIIDRMNAGIKINQVFVYEQERIRLVYKNTKPE